MTFPAVLATICLVGLIRSFCTRASLTLPGSKYQVDVVLTSGMASPLHNLSRSTQDSAAAHEIIRKFCTTGMPNTVQPASVVARANVADSFVGVVYTCNRFMAIRVAKRERFMAAILFDSIGEPNRTYSASPLENAVSSEFLPHPISCSMPSSVVV